MKGKYIFVGLIALLLSSSCKIRSLNPNTNSSVRKAMRKYVMKTLINDKDRYTFNGKKVSFDHIEKEIKIIDNHYVSCIKFSSGIDIDIYVKDIKGSYKVVKEVLHKKNGIEVNKVLWEKSSAS